MATTPVPGWAATTAAMSGSPRKPQTSLTITAPASSAADATAALRVSTLIGTRRRPASSRITGNTRAISTSTDTSWRVLDGLVLSPPMSTTSAPASTIDCARATAAGMSSPTPSPEKESGVTLTMPITRVRFPNSSR